MVSGTPLHNSIDDLNGELAFLGVWPFCLLDSEDGFWEKIVAEPFKQRDAAALDLLHALLKVVMIRHSKAQASTLIFRPPSLRFESRLRGFAS